MAYFTDLEKSVADYHDQFRNTKLPPFTDQGFLDLFPDASTPPIVSCDHDWNDSFPHVGIAGVYSIFSDELELLYIGETDNYSSRMMRHFGGTVKSGCLFREHWKGEPRFVHFYQAPSQSKFETPALEGFLILELATPNNRKIKYR